jgi:hypothetical protein
MERNRTAVRPLLPHYGCYQKTKTLALFRWHNIRYQHCLESYPFHNTRYKRNADDALTQTEYVVVQYVKTVATALIQTFEFEFTSLLKSKSRS